MRSQYWKPKRKEIEEWLEKQFQEFAIKENYNTILTVEKWKNKYIFIEIYKIFFMTFATEPQEWLERLVDFQKCWKIGRAHV